MQHYTTTTVWIPFESVSPHGSHAALYYIHRFNPLRASISAWESCSTTQHPPFESPTSQYLGMGVMQHYTTTTVWIPFKSVSPHGSHAALYYIHRLNPLRASISTWESCSTTQHPPFESPTSQYLGMGVMQHYTTPTAWIPFEPVSRHGSHAALYYTHRLNPLRASISAWESCSTTLHPPFESPSSQYLGMGVMQH